jgi:hypothetical protein
MKTLGGVPGARRLQPSVLFLAAIFVLLAAHPASAQCAMCRRALDSPEGRQMIAAFRGGILILLAAPFASFAAVALLAVRRFRRPEDSPGP